MGAGKSVADFLAFLDSAQKRYAAAMVEEREANAETQDILHALELQRHNPRKAARLMKTLGDIRRRRRLAKDDMEIADLILKFQNGNAGMVNALQRLQGDIQTTLKNRARRDYQFRTDIMVPYLNENALTDAANIGQSGKES